MNRKAMRSLHLFVLMCIMEVVQKHRIEDTQFLNNSNGIRDEK